jgi:di/tricarboxylate transporter
MDICVDKKKMIGWLISILIPVIIALIPVSANYTESLKMYFTITLFVILIIAFELLPQLISAFLLPSLYLISGLVPAGIAFSSWTGTTVWMVLGGLIFSIVLDECGLLKRIAYYVISKCGGTYNGAVFGCFFIGIILNLITFCYGWLVASPLVFGVCKAMDLKPSRESSLLCFAGTIGATGTTIFLYYPGYFAIMEAAIREFIPNYSMTIFSSFIYNGFSVVLYLLTLLILMKVYKTKEMNMKFSIELFDEKYRELGKISSKEKKAVVMIVLLLVYLFTTRFTGFPAAYGFMSIPFLMFLPGIEIGDNNTIGKLNFSMIFFVSTCLGIGIVGAEVGFGEFLTNIAVPMLSGKSPLVACIAFMLFGTIANFFMTPFAMLGGLSLTFAQIAVSLGISPIAAVMILLYSCEILVLPYQSAGNLIMYSYGLMPMKDFVKQESLKAVIMIIGFIVVMYPLWNVFGLM